jgi:copper resistance protein C
MNRRLTAIALLFVLASSAQAHTSLRSSNPASGSVLTESTAVFSLTFLETARMTSLVLVTAAGERKLEFAPVGSAVTFTVTGPGFEAGRNEVRWKALSQDGHVIEGSVIIVIRPQRRPGD